MNDTTWTSKVSVDRWSTQLAVFALGMYVINILLGRSAVATDALLGLAIAMVAVRLTNCLRKEVPRDRPA